MDKKTIKLAALFMSLLAMFSFSSCSDDDSPTGDGEQKEAIVKTKGNTKFVTLPNSGYGADNWIYFSFAEAKIIHGINESNRADNLKWDIAFYRYNVRTNGGLSGKGQGGSFDTEETNMNNVTEVPEVEFTTDVMGEVTKDMTSFPPPTMKTPLNEGLSHSISFQGPPPEYTPNNHVYIVRTPDGKFAKIKITGFHNDEGESGHIQFNYVYQPDGSKDLNL